MTDKVTDIPMLNVDGQNYIITELPTDIQELIGYYQTWEASLKAQRLESFKTEAAMRSLTNEITTRVKMMVATKAAKDAADAVAGEQLKEAATTALNDSLVASAEAANDEPANDVETPVDQEP